MNVNEIASLGSNVKPVIQNENCAVLMLNDATGEGVMTVYRVMPGVMICFSDMYMEQCASEILSVYCYFRGLPVMNWRVGLIAVTGAAVSLIQDEIEIEWNFDDIFSEQR